MYEMAMCPSVRMSQAGVLSEWLVVYSRDDGS